VTINQGHDAKRPARRARSQEIAFAGPRRCAIYCGPARALYTHLVPPGC
jgi:hypothetical protein